MGRQCQVRKLNPAVQGGKCVQTGKIHLNSPGAVFDERQVYKGLYKQIKKFPIFGFKNVRKFFKVAFFN